MNLTTKKALILGVRNKYSIGYSIAKYFLSKNWNVIIDCETNENKNKIQKLLKKEENYNNFHNSYDLIHNSLDVKDDKVSLNSLNDISNEYSNNILSNIQNNKFDAFIHCMAYAPPNAMKNQLIDTTMSDFTISHIISSYSFLLLSNILYKNKLLNNNSSLITLSYIGANRPIEGYNIMGPAKASLESNVRGLALELGKYNIRVNGISSGPINTLSSRGISNFHQLYKYSNNKILLKNNNINNNNNNNDNNNNDNNNNLFVSSDDIAHTVNFLIENKMITGQIIYVDGGFNISI